MALLDTYNRKRRFDATPEPAGTQKKKKERRLRFVVQEHHASRLHYDFRLEVDGVLKSWAVPKGPSLNPHDKRLAMMVEDHPYEYRTFEGIIPKGNYGAGSVIIWDEGVYEPRKKDTKKSDNELMSEGIKKGEITFVLHGKKLQGEFALIKMKKAADEHAWLLVKKDDEHASMTDVTKDTASVVSGLTNQDIEQGKMRSKKKNSNRRRVDPMLATLIDKPFSKKGWLFEMKLDGYRAIADIDDDILLYSRKGNSFAKQYPDIVAELKKIPEPMILDGEIVVVDEEGIPHFHLMQQYAEEQKGTLLYYVFDILEYHGKSLKETPLIERKKMLKKLIPSSLSRIRYLDYVEEAGVDFFAAVGKLGIEGMIGKKVDSFYHEGSRSAEWVKVKHEKTQEAIIVGYTEPRGSLKFFGALVLGIYQKGKLAYIGHTGGGFTDQGRKEMFHLLQPLEQKKSAFEKPPKTNAPAHWVKPVYMCEVRFSNWTGDGHMRHPIFLGLRTDKSVAEIGKEEPKHAEEIVEAATNGSHSLDITNPEKVWWPKEKYTKGDVIAYYDTIAEFILPYVINRPHSLHRHPNGIAEASFYQKDITGQVPDWVPRECIYSESNQKEICYYVVRDKESLLYMANLGCIEINPWNSTVDALEYPTFMVIDLDPEGVSFARVIETAREVHRLCDSLDIPTYCKTSGKTGLHIYVPLAHQYTYEQTKLCCELLMRFINAKFPDLTSMERMPQKRRKKIYLDYLQNRKGQTMAAPYSLRPEPHAPVSMPLRWSEVKSGLSPKQFTIKNARERISKMGDIWKPVLETGIDIEKILKRIQE